MNPGSERRLEKGLWVCTRVATENNPKALVDPITIRGNINFKIDGFINVKLLNKMNITSEQTLMIAKTILNSE